MIPEAYLQQPQALPTFLYGCYTMALTLYLLVPAITQAFGVSALPAVTAGLGPGKQGGAGDPDGASVLRVTALFCFPAGVGLSALAGPVTRLLYGDSQSWPITARALGLLGAGLPGRGHEHPPLQHAPGGGPGGPAGEAAARRHGHQAGGQLVCCARSPRVNILGAAVGTLLLLPVFDGGPAVVPAAGRRGGAVHL